METKAAFLSVLYMLFMYIACRYRLWNYKKRGRGGVETFVYLILYFIWCYILVKLKPGPAFGWGEWGPCPGRLGGAEQAVTDRPHINT
jgi:hypothetical protein